jgi:hypothetical protein
MVRRLAADVCMFARREVEALDGAEPLEDFEGSEHRRPSDTEVTTARGVDQLGGREVADLVRDESRQCTARLRQPESGAVHRGHDR